ncbi:MAG: thioredoxin domain-containing protein [Terriglobus sp.]
MSEIVANALSGSSSSYLRSAMHQPVQWLPWGPEAFERAQAEDKPVLLDVGAVWCHWCHVMDRESYEDGDTAALINEFFIPVKVDRDERPDIDARYQSAVAAISGQGGWPLTAFLTPDGRPYFGGTYFPPEERYGRPSFQRVLMMMAGSYRNQRVEVFESASSVMEAIEQGETFSGAMSDLEKDGAGIALLHRMVDSALKQYDPVNGGFGAEPKFLHPGALSMLVDAASRKDANSAHSGEAVLNTLKKMARGGIYDQLGGGFHRYSVDERWIVPHFEKMSYDNSEMLRSYCHAFQTFADADCAATARGIVRWMDEWLCDREKGGFFSSQDADQNLQDDGGYFTWSKAEAAEVLTPDELKFAEAYFDIGAVGDMRHDPTRNVLYRPMTLEKAAQIAGVDAAMVPMMLKMVRGKLYQARLKRPTPFVDRTLYTGWNAMCISSFVTAGRALQIPKAIAFAKKSLDRVLDAALRDGAVTHVVAYAEASQAAAPVAGVLDDYVFLGHACLDVWETCAEPKYYAAAETIAETLLRKFYDGREGGFFDTASDTPELLGALITRRKPIQDSPTPAGNPGAAMLLLRLHELSGKQVYRDNAQETLETFAGIVEHFGLYAATFAQALARLAYAPVQVVIVGEGAEAERLELIPLAPYAVNRTVIRVKTVDALPPALAETVGQLPAQEGVYALVCSGMTCHPPVRDVEGLVTALSA